MELYEQTIHDLQGQLQARQVSSVEITSSFLNRIESTDPSINALSPSPKDRHCLMQRQQTSGLQPVTAPP